MKLPAKWLVYLLSLSMAATFGLIGWTIWENHAHQQQLSRAVEERQWAVNEFLRLEVCERLELRDEIQISYLQAASSKYAYTDPAYATILSDAARALELTQRGCKAQIPGDG